MKLTELYSYKSSGQIWRILISDLEKLVLETRDRSTKEVSLQCFNLFTGENIFSDLQLEEKHWIGIETIYKDIILFHKFPKPDMPGHKEIIAFNIDTQKILWTNNDLSFLFAYADKVYGYKQGFEERYFTALNCFIGEIEEDLGTDYLKVNLLRNEADNEKDWSVYTFPKIFVPNEDYSISNVIKSQTENLIVSGNIEYILYYDLLLFNYHIKESDTNTFNKFTAIDLKSNKIILDKIINTNVRAFFTDSFFVYKNLLILLREKNEVIIYSIE
jgi:hypothetical protein